MSTNPPRPPSEDPFDLNDSPWPHRAHTLDARNADFRSAAYFYGDSSAPAGRINGFRRATQLLFEDMMASSLDRNTLVYPYAHSWRHTIELQLKELLVLLRMLRKATFDDRFLTSTHNLQKLWNKALPTIKQIPESECSPGEVATVTRLIGQLTALDPDGQELRYHQRTDGTPTLAKHSHIDLPRFHEALQGVSAYLEGATIGTYEELEYEQEMAREFGP